MGKQAGFFMTFTDELTFLSAVQKEFGPLEIVANTARTEREIIASLRPVDASIANLLLVRADDLDSIVSTHVAAQNFFCVDLLQSEVVQFSRCKPMDGWLAPGRLWFEEKLNHGKKSAGFRAWASKLLSWFSKNWNRASDGLHFVGPEAEKLACNGLLELGPPRAGMSPEQIKKVLGIE